MRQTNFFQTPADELELLELILSSAPADRRVVLLDLRGARAASQVRSYTSAAEVPPVGPQGEHELLFPALLGGPLEVRYLGGQRKRELRIDQAVSPVCEYQRCSRVGNQILRGRIYAIDHDLVPRTDDARSELVPFNKGEEWTAWINEITRWLRARYETTVPPGPFLVAPGAASWHAGGGLLAECGFNYRPASHFDEPGR